MSGIYCPCGREITRNQHCAESDEDYAKRLAAQRCRAKCARLYPPSPTSRVSSLEGGGFNHKRPELRAVVKEVPERDAKYLDWIRSLPCLICGGESEAHHQNRRKHGGKSTTASDYRALCLCNLHHTGGGSDALPGSYHGLAGMTGWRFWDHYGIDVETTITRLNEEYNRIQADKRIRGIGQCE